MKLEQVIELLQINKGNGAWRAVADEVGVHYDTVARIARRRIANPGANTVEAIGEALKRRVTSAAE